MARIPSKTIQKGTDYTHPKARGKSYQRVDTGLTKSATAVLDKPSALLNIQDLDKLSHKDFLESIKGTERAVVLGVLNHINTFRKLSTRGLSAYSQDFARLVQSYKQLKDSIQEVQKDEESRDYLSRLFGSVSGQLDIAIRGTVQAPCTPRTPRVISPVSE